MLEVKDCLNLFGNAVFKMTDLQT